jgi:hypothetical protein
METGPEDVTSSDLCPVSGFVVCGIEHFNFATWAI